jgi:hypothetical protein
MLCRSTSAWISLPEPEWPNRCANRTALSRSNVQLRPLARPRKPMPRQTGNDDDIALRRARSLGVMHRCWLALGSDQSRCQSANAHGCFTTGPYRANQPPVICGGQVVDDAFQGTKSIRPLMQEAVAIDRERRLVRHLCRRDRADRTTDKRGATQPPHKAFSQSGCRTCSPQSASAG